MGLCQGNDAAPGGGLGQSPGAAAPMVTLIDFSQSRLRSFPRRGLNQVNYLIGKFAHGSNKLSMEPTGIETKARRLRILEDFCPSDFPISNQILDGSGDLLRTLGRHARCALESGSGLA